MTAELDAPAFPAAADIAIARQPIHDRHLRVVGYELLFRGTPGLADEERAASAVIVETLTGVGLRAVAGRRPAHVPVSRRFLLDGHALALPAHRVVLEVRDPDPADAALAATLGSLADRDYAIALAYRADAVLSRRLLAVADTIKLDTTDLSADEIVAAAGRFAPLTDTLTACAVDAPSAFNRCRAAGFNRFQGFFFCTPDVVRAAAPPTTRLGELRALAALHAPAISFEEFERVIARDPGLSYRLLAYLNSAFFNLPRHVASVREALMMLGMRAVRRWATLVALAAVDDKPHELTVTALIRARLCELIGRHRPAQSAGGDAFFTVGLFSAMDAMLDAPLRQVLDPLPLTDDARAALLGHEGAMGDALAAVLAYERGQLDEVERRVPGVPMIELYLAALAWADAAGGALADDGADHEESGEPETPADGAPASGDG